jgi:F1F0 ATPase subunit 2
MTDVPISTIELAMIVPGFALGLGYFASLRWTVRLFAEQRRWLGPVLLTVGRMVAAIVLLAAMAKIGVVAALAAFVGFWLARYAAVRAMKTAS